MKRTFLLLLFTLIILYVHEGYKIITDKPLTESLKNGLLSDIAGEVRAIPLRPPGESPIEKARGVRQEGDNVFLVSNDILYRFNKSGEFLCRVTDPQIIKVGGYLIDPLKRILIVMGNTDDIHYYSFSGELINCKKLESDGLSRKIHSITYHDKFIWAAEERMNWDEATQEIRIEKEIVKYDSFFRKIESFPITATGLEEKAFCPYSFPFQLGIIKDTGNIYAYAPYMHPENLLRDTLIIRNGYKNPIYQSFHDEVTVYPLRFGNRYWISTYLDPYETASNYTFCFDRESNKSWLITGGFKDNFYQTGFISDMQPIDAYGNQYCYWKTGEELKEHFPEQMESGNPVLFIVTLKG